MDRTLCAILVGAGWFPEQSGGLDKGYTHHFQQLRDVGVEVRGLVTGSPAVTALSEERAYPFAATDAPLLERWRGVRRTMHRLLEEERPDLVASHFALYTFPVLDLIRRYPLVVHFHGPWALESRVEGGGRLSVVLKGQLEGTVYRRATRYIVLTQAFADVLQETFGVSESKISIVPGGVDTARFDTGLSRKEARAQLDWPKDRPLALVVRRLVRRVGLENLITAMTEVCKRVPDVLLIAGKGPLAGELEARIEATRLRPERAPAGLRVRRPARCLPRRRRVRCAQHRPRRVRADHRRIFCRRDARPGHARRRSSGSGPRALARSGVAGGGGCRPCRRAERCTLR